MQTKRAIPIIDMSAAHEESSEDLIAVAREVAVAFEAVGFCYIVGHGLGDATIRAAARASLEFFRLPIEEKRRSTPTQSVRGFNAIGKTRMYGAERPDHKEYYQIGLDLAADHPLVMAGQPLRGPNRWPDAPAEFRPAMNAYFEEIGQFAQRFLRLVALSLGAPAGAFASKYRLPLQRTQAVYYPPHPRDDPGDLYGVAPHTDYGCVTLLWQDDVGGLEVRDRGGNWIEAEPVPGSLVVNIGDLLARWSNDRYRSTPHRVTNRSGRERLSIATFYDPDYDAVVNPADLGLTTGEAAVYPAIRAGDYIMGRIEASQEAARRAATRLE